MSEERDWLDPKYKAWRLAVYRRDGFRCRMPGCRSRKQIHAHHIRRWADAPSLRFVVRNGITLCRSCHDRVYGVEDEYQSVFLSLVGGGDNVVLQMIMGRCAAMSKKEPSYTVLRDTAEHKGKGWIFEKTERCQGTVDRNLYTADYSLEGYYDNKIFVVERKGSVAEFAGNLTNKEKWDDFRQVLERMEEFRWPYLVLEFPLSLIRNFPVGSGIPKHLWDKLKFRGPFLMKRVCEIELKFKTKVVYADRHGKEYVSSLFKRVVEACPPSTV